MKELAVRIQRTEPEIKGFSEKKFGLRSVQRFSKTLNIVEKD